MNKHFYMIFLLFVISAFTPPVFGVETCLVKNKGINFTKDIELSAYKREYFTSSWKDGEEENEKKGVYPIYSILIYNGKMRVAAFASEYVATSLKLIENSNRFLIDDPWQLWGSSGGVRDEIKNTLLKYSGKSVQYFLEVDSNPNCNTTADLMVAIYKNNIKVENIHYKIKEMNPKEVEDRIKHDMQ